MTKRWVRWNADEINKLKKLYLKTTLKIEEIANIIERTTGATAGKLMTLRISRVKDAPQIKYEMRCNGQKDRPSYSEETKYRMGSTNRGKHLSKETCDKISKSSKGRKAWNEGKKLTEEHKKKIGKSSSEALMGHIVSDETREKISQHHLKNKISVGSKNPMYGKSKELSPNWKGGKVTNDFIKEHGMNPQNWIYLTRRIRKRDNYICQYCGKRASYEIHHILPRRIRIDNHPDNLITLCKHCHGVVEHLTTKYIEQNRNPVEVFYDKWSEQ